MPATLCLQHQGEGRIARELDLFERVHLNGDAKAHCASRLVALDNAVTPARHWSDAWARSAARWQGRRSAPVRTRQALKRKYQQTSVSPPRPSFFPPYASSLRALQRPGIGPFACDVELRCDLGGGTRGREALERFVDCSVEIIFANIFRFARRSNDDHDLALGRRIGKARGKLGQATGDAFL